MSTMGKDLKLEGFADCSRLTAGSLSIFFFSLTIFHSESGGPGEPAYAASKGAVINLTRQVSR